MRAIFASADIYRFTQLAFSAFMVGEFNADLFASGSRDGPCVSSCVHLERDSTESPTLT